MIDMEKWVDHAYELYNNGASAEDAIKEARVLMNNSHCYSCPNNKNGFCFKNRKIVKES